MHNILALLPLLLPAQSGSGLEFEGNEIFIPMDQTTGHVGVMVRIGDSEPMLFQIDTYASIDATIDDDVAKALGLRSSGTALNSDGVTTRTKQLVEIPSLVCGGATFTNLRTLVDDYDWIGRSDGRKVAGLLGFSAFRELLVTFDYPGNQIILRRGSLEADGPHVIPFLNPSGCPDVDLIFGDRKLRFGIDTGAGSGLRMKHEDIDGLQLAGPLKRVGSSRTVYAEYALWGARLRTDVSLAGHLIPKPEALFVEGGGIRILGYGILKDFAMTFDQRRKLVMFEPRAVPATKR